MRRRTQQRNDDTQSKYISHPEKNEKENERVKRTKVTNCSYRKNRCKEREGEVCNNFYFVDFNQIATMKVAVFLGGIVKLHDVVQDLSVHKCNIPRKSEFLELATIMPVQYNDDKNSRNIY